jgi:hypothetical protein
MYVPVGHFCTDSQLAHQVRDSDNANVSYVDFMEAALSLWQDS